MTILVKKVFISSKPTFVYLLCPPLCGPFSIQESAAGGLSYKAKKRLNKSIAFLHKQIYNNVFQLTDFHLTINKGCRNIFPHPLLTIVFYSNSFSGLIFHINLMLSGVEIVSF